jgi:hypothetical protein
MGILMSSFLGGLISGSLIGVVVTLLALMIVAGAKSQENPAEGQVPNRKVFLAALVLLVALLLSVLLIPKLGGSKTVIAVRALPR